MERSLLSGGDGGSFDFDTELFEVELPYYVRPGHPFALKARGIRVLVNCPINGYPGQKIRFRLPVALFANAGATPKNASATAVQRLKYDDKDGWSRTVRVVDQQFQWVRMDRYGGIDDRHLHAGRFDPDKSAFCRRIDFIEGRDPRVRDGLLALVPAHEATCGSVVRNEQGQAIITYPDLADVQVRSFEEKASWLRQKCEDLEVDWYVPRPVCLFVSELASLECSLTLTILYSFSVFTGTRVTCTLWCAETFSLKTRLMHSWRSVGEICAKSGALSLLVNQPLMRVA